MPGLLVFIHRGVDGIQETVLIFLIKERMTHGQADLIRTIRSPVEILYSVFQFFLDFLNENLLSGCQQKDEFISRETDDNAVLRTDLQQNTGGIPQGLIADGVIDVRPMISRKIRLEQFEEGIEMVRTRPEGFVKAVFVHG